ncbi:MAG: DUF4197 domain-containing protein [Nonlabens ulvanivorans]|uniref:Uncharacterized protein DUF4197 n=2 Tax=Nonlabens ulvanivorans TaxID=906888 RepID=A0A081D9X8_NONUL|nr:DUF4197 domain-containing protein [Nonlabens ulvanivorans]KEZ92950.1 hypothetical protein IL45_12550 [Nonlabens ulvanivorans]PRX12820.1 uncharacterized protein DUF4197 [Nonlabens ulvanivorans]GAK75724.1 hypothetical protein JCM19296_1316 [Nonlabens ulvanivorans]GAL75448.1 hypothetical protein JCM19275_1899 [Nonlabens ulvanivorans]
MKKIIILLTIAISFNSCGSLNEIVNSIPSGSGGVLSQADIGNGLRQALDQGIDKEVSKLMATDGFYRNELVKILLPEELQKVDDGLRKIGLSSVADEGLKLLNRAAEDATKEALPIFVDAVKGISFNDAKQILLGDQRAATSYLENATQQALYAKFSPIINNKLGEVGATELWSGAINKYNSLPLTSDVNPDLTDYVTQKALEGVYKMIAQEEIEIRSKVSSRGTDLLQRVFALQD